MIASRIPMDHLSRVGLGRAEACSLNSMIPNPNGGGQQANRITCKLTFFKFAIQNFNLFL
jgi:hypothetical protein